MANYKGTETEKNLWEAFAGEAKARDKYNYYAAQARKDGYQQIAQFFDDTAANEEYHGKMWFRELAGLGGGTGYISQRNGAVRVDRDVQELRRGSGQGRLQGACCKVPSGWTG